MGPGPLLSSSSSVGKTAARPVLPRLPYLPRRPHRTCRMTFPPYLPCMPYLPVRHPGRSVNWSWSSPSNWTGLPAAQSGQQLVVKGPLSNATHGQSIALRVTATYTGSAGEARARRHTWLRAAAGGTVMAASWFESRLWERRCGRGGSSETRVWTLGS